MTSLYDVRQDAPSNLKYEALRIDATFVDNKDGTGLVSWNVPTPLAGCKADDQAYNGALVTIDTVPPEAYVVPEQGKKYQSDPTADDDLFAGDRIGNTRKVIGAFYNDRDTDSMLVSGLQPDTPYYVTVYPCDSQYRYYVSGVHAFSNKDDGVLKPSTSGYQVVYLNHPNGVKPDDSTGLLDQATYDLTVYTGVDAKPQVPYPSGIPRDTNINRVDISFEGLYATTFASLVSELNRQFAAAEQAHVSESTDAPQAGTICVTVGANGQHIARMWDGNQYTSLPLITHPSDPTNVVDGTLWYDSLTNTLKERQTNQSLPTWTVKPFVAAPDGALDAPKDGAMWYDGQVLYRFNGYDWCHVDLVVSPKDPSTGLEIIDGSFWLKESESKVYKWSTATSSWIEQSAIISTQVPTVSLQQGSYWINTSDTLATVSALTVAGWSLVQARITDVEPSAPLPNQLWFSPLLSVLHKRDATNTSWTTPAQVVGPNDPIANQPVCEVWATTTNHTVYVKTATGWVAATHTYSSENDPSINNPSDHPQYWLDTSTNQLFEVGCSTPIDFVVSGIRPDNLPDGTIWHRTTTDTWQIRTQGAWTPVTVMKSESDPASIPEGTYWFTSRNGLKKWNGANWVSVLYQTTPVTIPQGSKWYKTDEGQMYEWNGARWIKVEQTIHVELNEYGFLVFKHTLKGSKSGIRIDPKSNLWLSMPSIQPTVGEAIFGDDEVLRTPMYEQLGVGTDGTSDERSRLSNEIRMLLGYPNVTVEVTPEQLDLAIDQTIELIRSRSSLGYKRGFMKLGIMPEKQRYTLSNKLMKYHKISSIMGVYRMTSAFMNTAHGAGVYGQMVLQHLYNMGTFDLLSYHIISEYTHLMEILFAMRVTFTWNEQTREIHLHQRFPFHEKEVLMDVVVERTEQEIMQDRIARPWIRKMALAYTKLMLAETRGKFGNLPGPAGSISLNATDLRTSAEQTIAEGIEEIENYALDTPEEYGSGSQVVFG